MINRRCIRKLVGDLMKLLYFVSGQKVKFPAAILKNAATLMAEFNPAGDERFFTFEYTEINQTECMNVLELNCVSMANTSMEQLMIDGLYDEERCDGQEEGETGMRCDADVETDSVWGPPSTNERNSIMSDDIAIGVCDDQVVTGMISGDTMYDGEQQEDWEMECEYMVHKTGQCASKLCGDKRSTERNDPEMNANELGKKNDHASRDMSRGYREEVGHTEVSEQDDDNDEWETFIEDENIECEESGERCESSARPDNMNRAEDNEGCEKHYVTTCEPLYGKPEAKQYANEGAKPALDKEEVAATGTQKRQQKHVDRKQQYRSRRAIGREGKRYSRVRRGDNHCVCDSVIALLDRMAQRPIGSGRDRARRDESRHRSDIECERRHAEMDEWRENYVRRAAETEEVLVERMRKLRLQNDKLEDELRAVKKKLSEVNNQRPARAVPMEANPNNRGPLNPRAASNIDRAENSMRRSTRDGGNDAGGQRDARPRAATFSGRPRRSDEQTAVLTRRDNDGGKSAAEAVAAERPLPQRATNARGKKKGGSKPIDPPTETPLSGWLATARPSEQRDDVSPPRTTNRAAELVSPSWADQDDLDTTSESESMQSTPPPAERAADREKGADGGAGPDPHDDHDDVYEMPPSGQVTRGRNGNGIAPDSSGHGGARPKTTGKKGGANKGNANKYGTGNEKKGQKDVRANQKTGNNGDSRSYAKVVTRNGWKTAPTKKRKVDNVSPKPAPTLKGRAATRNRDIYLQGLDMIDCNDQEEMVESIRNYCKERNIIPIYIRLIPVKYDCTRTGCKLTVKECDFEDTLDDEFWPDDVHAREWKRNRDNDDDGDRPQSGEEGH